MGDLFWQWQYLGVLYLGTIACASESSRIRQQALEDGLLYFAQYGEHKIENAPPSKRNHKSTTSKKNIIETGHDFCWKIRAGATITLIEVYQQFRGTPHGLLAREMLSNRKKIETETYIQNLLHSPAANIPQPKFARQLSFLGKYICTSIAELHSDSLNDYDYHKKTIKSIQYLTLKNKKHVQKSNAPPSNLSTRDAPTLSLEPYHKNYKRATITPGECAEEAIGQYFDQFKRNVPVALGASTLGAKNKLVLNAAQVSSNGTVNRRKLFNPRASEMYTE